MNSSNVLFVGPVDKAGGMGAVLRTYSEMFTPFIFIPTHDSAFKYGFLFFIKSFFSVLFTLIRNKSILVLHIHVASYGSFFRKSIIAIIGKLFNKKVVLHIHGGGFLSFYEQNKIISLYIGFIFSISDLIICLSPDWKSRLSFITALTPYTVLSNPVQDIIHPREKRKITKLKLLYLGAITQNKGIFNLIDYFSTNPYFLNHQIHLSIAGIGELSTLNDRINVIQAGDRINYLGWISKEDKVTLLLSHDILILPSFFEGLPVSILEALSAQMPVIATNVGAIPDIVIPGTNGWLFDPSDFTQLDSIFKEIFENTFLVEQYGLSSKSIVSPYLVESVKSDLERIYNSLI